MTNPNRKSVTTEKAGFCDRPRAEFDHCQEPGATGGAQVQCLITTAILTTTAFRLRDDRGLIEALRMLVRAVRPFASEQASEEDREGRRSSTSA